ncbi:MAG: hypothetical protein SAK29_07030 [Scytonema sp. PMC 1069.18]|nr:hypothetical protein [Scytonema sp. PMC 1069.18]MEC4883220.1 hypothetical protein [Scytonema sp. PMC 1070.18]
MRQYPLEQQTFFYRLIGRNLQIEISFWLPGIRIEPMSTEKHIVYNLTAITPISETDTEETTLFYTTLPHSSQVKIALLEAISNYAEDRGKVLVSN